MKSTKSVFQKVFYSLLFCSALSSASAQKEGIQSITTQDLESHLYFLASDELKGRATGEPGIEIAANYLAAQAKKIGLTALDDNKDFSQNYFIEENSCDMDASNVSIKSAAGDSFIMDEDFYMIIPPLSGNMSISGEVVFAGYGVNSEKYNYNDFSEVDVKDKILLVMDRAPMDETGTKSRFDDYDWNSMQNFNHKYPYISSLGPKAILLVFDPKSGHNCLSDIDPAYPKYLSTSKSLKDSDDPMAMFYGQMTKLLIIHRNVAEKILEGTGMDLQTLQNLIDNTLEPHSFPVPGKTVNFNIRVNQKETGARNIFGMIEGSDPKLKKECLIYMAHFDHVGTNPAGDVYNGADDNASGSTALLEIAEAFLSDKEKSKRSIGFLWVSGEEIGLFGSKYYSDHPVIPLNQTAAVINLDMIGRTRTPADTGNVMGEELSIVGGDTIGIIGGLQSKILMDINKQTLVQMKMTGDYTYNDPHHPDMYFYRSDHLNFLRHDIPFLFYSTGTHRDYHQLTDSADKIDFNKLKEVTDLTFMVGYNIANYKGEIVVDNPFSKWEP
jgi:hypothetical protein